VTTAGLFAGSLVIIVVASELFTNAVEWAGFRMRLASGATGSLLAALGTALPETIVPIVAVAARRPASNDIAMGAVIGAPFLLLTLGVAVTGLATASRRGAPDLVLDRSQVRRDLSTFAAAFVLLLIALLLPLWARAVVAVAVLCIYAAYVRATLRGGVPAETMPEPLHLVRWRESPHGALIAVQLVTAAALLIVGANLFVRALENAASFVHLPTLLLSLILVPVATEMPETLNSVLWVRSGDDGLAFGNIAGATAFQACIPGAFGLAFTTWSPGRLGVANALLTLVAAAWTFALLRRGRCRGWYLATGALAWGGYVVAAAIAGGRLQ